VPYFAHRRFIPLVAVSSYEELFALAKRSGARFLFYASRETERCPQLLALLDPGTALPGLELVQRRLSKDLHYFALYRFTGEAFAAEDLERAAIQAAHHFAVRNPGDPLALTTLADQLLQAHRPREALEVLAVADRVEPDFPPAARFRAMAYFELGLVDSAAIASARVLRSGSASSWDWQLFGRIMLRRGRADEARTAFARALQLDPARDDIRRELARVDSLAKRSPPPGGGRP
jgi:tetratricopeptide (TPR) repeat protein